MRQTRPSLRWPGALVLALAAALFAAASAPSAQRSVPRIVAIGDIHGEIQGLVRILQEVGLIDEQRNWTGGRTTLVQTGDFTDRGTHVREVMDLLMTLEGQAPRSGGRVEVLLGNHEAMNLVGDLRDVTPAVYATFADEGSGARREAAYQSQRALGAARRPELEVIPPPYEPGSKEEWAAAHPAGFLEYGEAFAPGGKYGKWLRARRAVVQIGGVIFLHGGIHPDLAPSRLDHINRNLQRELRRWDDFQRHLVSRRRILPFFGLQEVVQVARAELETIAAQLARPNDFGFRQWDRDQVIDQAHIELLQEITRVGTWSLINPNGPLWFRGFAMWEPDEGVRHVERLLRTYRATHFVVGHTIPATFRITPRFSRRVFLIDTGMLATHYRGRPSALEIQDGRFTAIYLDGREVLVEPGGNED